VTTNGRLLRERFYRHWQGGFAEMEVFSMLPIEEDLFIFSLQILMAGKSIIFNEISGLVGLAENLV
jgi:hypothetical protein